MLIPLCLGPLNVRKLCTVTAIIKLPNPYMHYHADRQQRNTQNNKRSNNDLNIKKTTLVKVGLPLVRGRMIKYLTLIAGGH